MEEGIKRSKKHKKEEEIYNYNYDEPTTLQSDTSSQKHYLLKKASKETIGLSLEVEIADSLKQLITSPEKHNSSLLDVTIVRPTDLNCVRGIETNITNLNNSEIRNLIASMERQKQQKKKLIEEYKKHVVETQEKTRPKKRTEKKCHRKNIEVVSAHVKTSRNIDLKQPYTNSAPISILKPLMGQIKQSLKHLEDRIVEVGDHRPKEARVTSSKLKAASNSTSNDSNLSEEAAKRRRAKKRLRKLRECGRQRNQHVYATVNTFDRLRTMLKCQNACTKDHEDEKPCLCQHCGMIGLLMDSQKRPIMPSMPVKASGTMENQDGESTDTSTMDDQYYVIRELARRLKELEDRVAVQEQCAVPKEYFKRVIKKILNIQGSVSQQNMGSTAAQTSARHCGTQYGFDVSEDLDKKSKSKVRQRNVQIQQGYGRRYMINPLEVETNDITTKASQLNVESENKTISVITEFISKLDRDKEEEDKTIPAELFWKWGEEIIKPGVDLKMKIMCLLDERMRFVPESSNPRSNREERKISLLSLTETVQPTSSRAMKKMINLMSEKIYQDHVKPTVDAIKEEQNNLKKENTENLCHMKNEMEAAIMKINTNQSPQVPANDDDYLNKFLSERQEDYTKTYKNIKSFIPIRVPKTSMMDSMDASGQPRTNERKNSFIPKLKGNKNPSGCNNFEMILSDFEKHVPMDKHKRGQHNGKVVDITYVNPKVASWAEDSLASVPVVPSDDVHNVRLSSSASSSHCKMNSDKKRNTRIFKNHSITEKVEFLKSIASTEIVKSQLWANIWNQAKSYCKSKDDTVIIQIPTKLQNKHIGITEVEFTIEDIQQLMYNTDLFNSTEEANADCNDTGNMDSFLLIRSRKILEDVHKRLGNKFLRS